MIFDLIGSTFMLIGAAFSLIAAIGIFRMPDLYTRMHAAAKTGTLGVGCTIIGVAFFFGELGVAIRAVTVVAFLFLTAPIAAHMIARAGYLSGSELWSGTVNDDMRGQYDKRTHTLASPPTDEADLAQER